MAKKLLRLDYTTLLGEPKSIIETEDTFRLHCASSGLDPNERLDLLMIQYACEFPRSGMRIKLIDLSNLGQKK